MLRILGDASNESFCDGLKRRTFLQIGGMAFGGISLADILRAEAQMPRHQRKQHKAIINVFLPGGPPHQDMFDLKMEAPSEIRGEFKPIPTNVPGLEVCELFPRMAKMAERFSFIRSLVGSNGGHSSFQCVTGRYRGRQPAGGWPSVGSTIAKLQGPADQAIPPFVGLAPTDMGNRPWGDPGQPGYLGAAYAPFLPSGDGRGDMVLNGVSLNRLGDRKALLTSFDRFRRQADAAGSMTGIDAFQQQAFGILTSSKLADALDINQVDPRVRDRYGIGSPKKVADGGPQNLDHFLLARRLVEAGARCVSLAFSRWDWHGGNFRRARQDFPMLDQGLTALVEDLEQRGILDDVSIVVWGEFGRTPRINKNAGRDHWTRVAMAVLAGGGMRTGQVIGSTDRLGEGPVDRPVHFQDVVATLYHNIGINIDQDTVNDLSGRPMYVVDDGRQPIAELV